MSEPTFLKQYPDPGFTWFTALVELQQRGLIRHLGLSNVTATQVAEACGFTPLQSDSLSEVARRLGVTPMQVALAWLLARGVTAPIASATSVEQLNELMQGATLELSQDAVQTLNAASAY